ncbi:endonuclease domain-containing protein [Henriciella marina]|uniref:Endonuclease domain-containing protein n=1 Tax=Henriciella marina TaxID=453851 RepID=A0ABT4LWA4_9PROT|nr:endonuclease domain-containing protein [Henriciella marina]MCZ4298650.1 endonuclease domain-containing protein [Henriciella marina]
MREGAKTKLARAMRKAPTSAEAKLWARLRRRQVVNCRFRRQHPVGPFVADFACVERKVIVEVDGATHSTEAEWAHDLKRTEFLEAEGWKVVRASNAEVYENLEGVLEGIRLALVER